uniref:NADH dehydrogenase subunit 6 n=1 Tax=Phascolopsis gouldii TaxID=6442 RepID=Q952F0_PHAGO|nr:NADH dehydrogenase subunit 6 [Phascolopsis gouldii]
MLLSFFLSIFCALIAALPLAASPLFLGSWILMLGMSTATLLSLLLSPWMGMITALIYISGVNVLFAYFVASAPNHHLSSNYMHNTTSMAFILIFLTLLLTPMNFSLLYIPTSLSLITKLFTFPHSLMLLTLAIILFIALIAVVKVASRHYGPLRPFS